MKSALSISFVDDGINARPVIDFLRIITFKKMCQQPRVILTSEPSMETEIEMSSYTIMMTHIVEIQGLSGESTYQPMEEVVIWLDALIAVTLKFGDETISIPSLSNLMQVEDVEERIGHHEVSPARHSLSCIRTTDIDPSLFLCLPGQCQHCIKVGNEAIFVHIYGDVACLVLQHLKKVTIGSLINETNAWISRLLIQSATEQVKLLVEATTIKLNAKLGIHH